MLDADMEKLFEHFRSVTEGNSNQYFGPNDMQVYGDGPCKEIVMSQEFARAMIEYVDLLRVSK